MHLCYKITSAYISMSFKVICLVFRNLIDEPHGFKTLFFPMHCVRRHKLQMLKIMFLQRHRRPAIEVDFKKLLKTTDNSLKDKEEMLGNRADMAALIRHLGVANRVGRHIARSSQENLILATTTLPMKNLLR